MTAEDAAGPISQVTAPVTPHAAPREDVRRAVHAASGVLGPAAYLLRSRTAGALLLGGTAALAILLETGRRSVPSVARTLSAVAGPLFRPDEARALSGPFLLAAGYAVAWALFPPRTAAVAIVVAALADPAAALVGRRFGRGPGKSLAGSVACAVVAGAVIAVAGGGALPAVAGAVAAAVAERAPWRGADNLLVPAAVGAALGALGAG